MKRTVTNSKVALSLIELSPKIELHAHLTASMSRSAFKQMLRDKKQNDDLSFIDKAENNEELFRGVFGRLSKIVEGKKDLAQICKVVFQEFEDENCRYLEVRTTPKPLSDGTDAISYVETVLEEIENWKGTELSRSIGRSPMEIRYIISVNRAFNPDSFNESIKLVKRDPKWTKYITGLDYCGDPWKRDIDDFKNCIGLSRESGLKLTIHTAELPEQAQETGRIMAYKPERLGHFIYYTEDEFEQAKSSGTTIEACPSSNLATSPTLGLTSHPISEMYARGLNLTVCTDDKVIFNKTLSEEIFSVTDSFGYDTVFLKKIALDGINGSFLRPEDAHIQTRIRGEINEFFSKNSQ